MLRQRLEELGIAPGFQPFLEGWRRWELHQVSSLSWRAGCAEEVLHTEEPPVPNPSVTLAPPVALQSHLGVWETPLLLRGARLHSQPQNKAFLSKKKRSRGERSKRKSGRGRGTKGMGQLCTPAPALPELLSPGNSFLLPTAPAGVGLAAAGSWSPGRARERGKISLTCMAGKRLRC